MKAVQVFGQNDVRIADVATPVPGSDDVIVRIKACGICGSDLGYIASGHVAAAPDLPRGIGHESAGVVESVGANVKDIKPGLRVVVNPTAGGNLIGNGAMEGAFAPRLLVRNARLGDALLPISDSLDFERAALVEPLSVSQHAIDRADIKADDRVCIYGAGPIGLGIVFLLKRAGVRDIAIVDMSDSRLERARKLGASVTINPSRDNVAAQLGKHHGTSELFGWPVVNTNVFIEASGAPPVIPGIIGIAPFHARLVIVAVYHSDVPVSFLQVLAKEMTIISAMCFAPPMQRIVDAVESGGDTLDAMISHRFKFDDFMEALKVAGDRDASSKVIVTFPEDAAA